VDAEHRSVGSDVIADTCRSEMQRPVVLVVVCGTELFSDSRVGDDLGAPLHDDAFPSVLKVDRASRIANHVRSSAAACGEREPCSFHVPQTGRAFGRPSALMVVSQKLRAVARRSAAHAHGKRSSMGVDGGAPNIDGASLRGSTASVTQITFLGKRYRMRMTPSRCSGSPNHPSPSP
jgi:hypothetical protein